MAHETIGIWAGLWLLSGCVAGNLAASGDAVTDATPAGTSATAPASATPLATTQGGTQAPASGNDTGAGAPLRVASTGVAMYYGTGNNAGADPDLATLCASNEISTIVLSFADQIASHTRNLDGFPETAINGCDGAWDARNPFLQRCTTLGGKVATCQQAGKKVLLSLGGGGAAVGFQSDTEAETFAALIWQTYLGGNGNVRPFGSATLDGVDLDIEGGNSAGYAAFALKMRSLMDADTRKPYLITAAPQCVFPDEWMGPGTGTALTLALTAFDYLFIQYYNNDCRFADAAQFAQTWKQWTTLGAKQPKILVGLPAAADAADAASFVAGSGLSKIAAQVGNDTNFGGFMLWDAGYDADNIAKGLTPMRTFAAQALGKKSP